MRKNILIAIISLMLLIFAASCDKEDGPAQSPDDDVKHSITVEEVANGEVSTSVVEANSGETVNVIVNPDFGYVLKSDSLKANDVLIEKNTFVMPNKDVVISAQFVIGGTEYQEVVSPLMIECEADKKTAKASFVTKFADDGFVISATVFDERVVVGDTYDHSDGVVIMFSHKELFAGYIQNKTLMLKININGDYELLKYDGNAFVPFDTNYSVDISALCSNDTLSGYQIVTKLPYEVLGLTKDTAKGLLTICPVLINANTGSKLVSAKSEVSNEYLCDRENQNSYIVVMDDDTYLTNNRANKSYQLKVIDGDNEHWDLSKDYYPTDNEYADRKVSLTGTNENENLLTFYRTGESVLYTEASFVLKEVYAPEELGKFGYKFVDKYGDGFMFFMDAYGTSVSSMSTIREAGYVMIDNNTFIWNTHSILASTYVPSRNEEIKLAVYRDKGEFTLYVNDKRVASLNNPGGIASEAEIYPKIASFNLGIEVSKYMSSSDKTEYEDLIPSVTSQGYVFRDVTSSLSNGAYWDVTNDTEANSGPVYLTGHDGIDNLLFFNMTSKNFMYARATMKLTDYYNVGDRWLKFGLTLFDGDSILNGTQYMFYVDAFVNRNESANDIERIVGDGFGEVKRVNGNYQTWTTIDSSYRFNLQTYKVTMELVYDNGVVYFIADGNLIAQRNYRASGGNLYMGIKNFGLGMEVSNYYCTTDKNDSNIHTNIFKTGKVMYYFLGSSVTYGSANGGKSFVELLPSKLDCSVVKSSVSGTTLVSGNGSYVDRLKSQLPIGQTVEHLVVQLSTNDATLSKPIGQLSNGNYDTSTVIGAIEEIIDYAKKTWGCDITFYTNPYYNNQNYETMIDALYQVQSKWGIGILDFYNYRNMEALEAKTLSSYMSDSIHPNEKGYEWMAGVFANYLADSYAANHPGDSIVK